MVMDPDWTGWITLTDKDGLIVRVRMMRGEPFTRQMQVCATGENWVSFYVDRHDELTSFIGRLHDAWRV